ncbi:MAG: endo-1,4-beta-xylanase [Planctomycetes bacterium]|nr:endo-1,4-beta-xylanase [Planctomycetota bacterium]
MGKAWCGIAVGLAIQGVALAADGQSPDALLAGADARIREHRMGDLEITVKDEAGKPIPGARVRIQQVRHEFLFGCNIFMFGRFRTPEENAAYAERFSALLNYATLPFYWANFEPRRGQPRYDDIEKVARWCKEKGIATKGHPLVWNHNAGAPRWLPDDLDEIRKLSDARVRACVDRFRGLIDIFDVVNEAAQPFRSSGEFGNRMTDLARKIGIEDFTKTPFRIARDANPKATLLINDYVTDDRYAKVIDFLGEDGKRLYDVIGIQSHMHGGAWSSRRIWGVCEKFAAFGVPIHYTETTIVSGPRQGNRWGPTTPEGEAVQAREAVRFYTILFSHPAVEAITWWDFCDRGAWQGAAAGFLRADLSPKPIYEALLKKIKGEWWTESEGETDADGVLRIRAFFGTHRIAAKASDGRTAEARIELARKAKKGACALIAR